jgi:hypothetical protein
MALRTPNTAALPGNRSRTRDGDQRSGTPSGEQAGGHCHDPNDRTGCPAMKRNPSHMSRSTARTRWHRTSTSPTSPPPARGGCHRSIRTAAARKLMTPTWWQERRSAECGDQSTSGGRGPRGWRRCSSFRHPARLAAGGPGPTAVQISAGPGVPNAAAALGCHIV